MGNQRFVCWDYLHVNKAFDFFLMRHALLLFRIFVVDIRNEILVTLVVANLSAEFIWHRARY